LEFNDGPTNLPRELLKSGKLDNRVARHLKSHVVESIADPIVYQ
jgi:hypothetical protein